ncbi:MAG: ATP synthase F1 subunit epsilon [Bacteroidetes bacterium GWA2_31_9]|nr:MAG: ATP synthase F1 subunit epsilon [Bacteroidetes bacterium GWA2_31_9]
MFLEIVTPEKNVFSGDVSLIQLPGVDGSFEILKNHAPIVSLLERGNIKIRNMDGDEKYFEIDGGVVELYKNKVIVLAEMNY